MQEGWGREDAAARQVERDERRRLLDLAVIRLRGELTMTPESFVGVAARYAIASEATEALPPFRSALRLGTPSAVTSGSAVAERWPRCSRLPRRSFSAPSLTLLGTFPTFPGAVPAGSALLCSEPLSDPSRNFPRRQRAARARLAVAARPDVHLRRQHP